jgi:hypothetical protein
MLLTLGLVLLAPSAFATSIYDRDLVRGFISLKADHRYMNPKGQEFINRATGIRFINDDGAEFLAGKSYSKDYVSGHLEIGAKYNQLRTWFDIDFMPISPTRKYVPLDDDGNTMLDANGSPYKITSRWYAYGFTWMWGYELLPQRFPINLIPSIGPGFELLTVRSSLYSKPISCVGPSLNLEMELRVQIYQFSIGAYGGYKVVRHDGWDALSKNAPPIFSGNPYNGDVNADKVFFGVKLSWTMLSEAQKRLMDLQ